MQFGGEVGAAEKVATAVQRARAIRRKRSGGGSEDGGGKRQQTNARLRSSREVYFFFISCRVSHNFWSMNQIIIFACV